MIKQLNQSTIVTGNSMHLFNAAFCMHNFLTSEFYTFVLTLIIKNPAQTIEVFPFYFCNTCEIIEINTLINELTHVNLTKYLLSESS